MLWRENGYVLRREDGHVLRRKDGHVLRREGGHVLRTLDFVVKSQMEAEEDMEESMKVDLMRENTLC